MSNQNRGTDMGDAELFDVLGDPCARNVILQATQPLTSEEIARRSGWTEETVERRVEALVRNGFLARVPKNEGENGHIAYRTRVKKIRAGVMDDGLGVEVETESGSLVEM